MNEARQREIKRLVEAGNAAKEMFNMVLLEVEPMGDIPRKHYLKKLHKMLDERVVEKKKEDKPMNDVEAKTFGMEPMEYGNYRGTPIDSIPLDYLEWLYDVSYRFIRKLGRYLSSRRIKKE